MIAVDEAAAKTLARVTSAAVAAAVLSPVLANWRTKPRDSFPLSHYPMFSARRGATGTVTYLLGIDADGTRRSLPHTLVGPGGLNQVRRQLGRCRLPKQALAICDAVAGRIVLQDRSRFATLLEVRLVTGEYAFDDFFAGRREPMAENVHAAVAIPWCTA